MKVKIFRDSDEEEMNKWLEDKDILIHKLNRTMVTFRYMGQCEEIEDIWLETMILYSENKDTKSKFRK